MIKTRCNNSYKDNDIFGTKQIDNDTLTDNARALLSPRVIKNSNTFKSGIFYEESNFGKICEDYLHLKRKKSDSFEPKYKYSVDTGVVKQS